MVESYFTKNPVTQPDDSIDEKNKDLDKSKEAKPYLKRTTDKVKFNIYLLNNRKILLIIKITIKITNT